MAIAAAEAASCWTEELAVAAVSDTSPNVARSFVQGLVQGQGHLSYLVGRFDFERSSQVSISYLQQRGDRDPERHGDLPAQQARGKGSKRDRHGKEDHGQQALTVDRAAHRIQFGGQYFIA